jgi:hypothetical protein
LFNFSVPFKPLLPKSMSNATYGSTSPLDLLLMSSTITFVDVNAQRGSEFDFLEKCVRDLRKQQHLVNNFVDQNEGGIGKNTLQNNMNSSHYVFAHGGNSDRDVFDRTHYQGVLIGWFLIKVNVFLTNICQSAYSCKRILA